MASKTIKGLTVEIGGDTTKLSKALKDVEAKSRSLSKELGDINKLLKMDPGNMDLLAQKQEVLAQAAEAAAKKLETLKEAEKQVQEQFKRGEVSEEQLRALQREIVATENKMKGYQKAARQTAEAMEDMGDGAGESGNEAKKAAGKVDDFADAADDAERSSSELGKTLSGALVTGLKAVAALVGAAITGLVAAAESTREYRTEMGKLQTAYDAAGHSAEMATATYSTLQGVIGETDQSVEAAQQIALLAGSAEDAAHWAGLAAGVMGRFGDALMPEVFYESANETLKLNEATGSYVQLLEGAGYSVDDFNEGLAACTTEQEKQAYMLQITDQLLGGAAEKYRETNAEIIRANQANDAWMQSLAGAGAAVEPLVTDVKLLGASLLGEAVPAIQTMTDALRGVLSGDAGAAGQLGDALAGMISSLIQKITEALPAVAQVGISLVGTLVNTLITQLPQILATGGQIIMQLASGISTALPQILTTGGQVISQLLSGIVTALPTVAQQALNVIGNFVSGIQTYLPMVLSKGAELLGQLGEGIRQNLPALVSQALDIILNFAQTIYENAPMLIETGFQLLSDLVAGIMSSLPTLIAKVPEIISTFANTINDNFPTILMKGVQLIGQLVMGIIQAIPTLIANIPKIITAIVDVWEAFNWLSLGKKAITWLKDGISSMLSAVKTAGKNIMTGVTDALKNLPQNLLNLGKSAISDLGGAIRNGLSTVKSSAKSIFDGVVNTFKNLPRSLISVGKDLVRGLWDGISNMSGWVIGKIQGFCSNALGSIKSFFGIASPSRVLRDQVGKNLALGMAEGLEDNADAPITAMQHVSSGVLDAAQEINGLQVERSVQSRTAANQGAAANAAGIGSKLDAILAAIERGQVIALDSKLLIGATADGYDNTLGQRRALVARGAL